jgi:hypothetical protein
MSTNDDLTPHLEVLREELAGILAEQEATGARHGACTHWHALRTCERFLTTPAAFQPHPAPGRASPEEPAMRQHAIYDGIEDHCADLLTPTCPFCGHRGWITIPQAAADALMEGGLVQDALPDLGFRLREQITSGTHPRCQPGAEFGDGIDPHLIR